MGKTCSFIKLLSKYFIFLFIFAFYKKKKLDNEKFVLSKKNIFNTEKIIYKRY